MALFQKARATEESVRDDTDTGRAKEDPLAYGRGKDKRVVEKDREKRDPRDNSAAELSFRSQEAMSAEQFRSLQLQQQLTLQPYYYQQFLQSGVPLEMLKNLGPQLEYMPGMHVDAKAMLAAQLCQNMQPEQQMQIMQLHRQMALEQEKQVGEVTVCMYVCMYNLPRNFSFQERGSRSCRSSRLNRNKPFSIGINSNGA